MKRRARVLLAAFAALVSCSAAAADTKQLDVIDVRKIWSGEQHSAFTDLIDYKGTLLCTFREGQSHASPDGRIRVLASTDGAAWRSIAVLASGEYDLRDPKLSVTPDGRLMMNGGATSYGKDDKDEPKALARHGFVSFSDDGATWSKPQVVTRSEDDFWIWRVTWHDGTAYGIGKAFRQGISLVSSRDGVQFRRHEPPLLTEQWPNEATLRFTADGTAYCLVRREGELNAEGRYSRAPALLGVSKPPYTDWTWHDTGVYLGGPNYIQLPDGRWLVGGRTRQGPARMSLLEVNIDTGALKLLTHLPSGGDCSYPGMVWKDGGLWVSYYSSHEGKSDIYLARLQPK